MLLLNKFVIKTTLTENEIKEKLSNLIESSGGILKFYYGQKPYVGKIKENHFKICRIKPTSEMSSSNIAATVNVLQGHIMRGKSDVGALPMIFGEIKNYKIEIKIRPKFSDIMAAIFIPLIFLGILIPYILQNQNQNGMLILFILLAMISGLIYFYFHTYQLNTAKDKKFLEEQFC